MRLFRINRLTALIQQTNSRHRLLQRHYGPDFKNWANYCISAIKKNARWELVSTKNDSFKCLNECLNVNSYKCICNKVHAKAKTEQYYCTI